MHSKQFVLIIVLCLNFSACEQNHVEIIELINKFLVKQNLPTRIVSYLCWARRVQLEFLKKLSVNGFQSTMGKFNEIVKSYYPEQYHLFLIDLGCNDSKGILEKAHESKLFIHPFRWILLNNTKSPISQDLFFGIDSRVFVIEQYNSRYRIKSLYKVKEKYSTFIENDIAKWIPTEGFTQFNALSAPRNRSNLMGAVLKICYVVTHNDTLNHLEDYRDIHIDPIPKLSWKLVHHDLLAILNASSTTDFKSTWGYKNATTNIYTGMIGDLQTGEADLGGTPCFFTVDRMGILEFFAPSAPTAIGFIFRSPPLSYTTNIFTLPFDSYVWYCSFLLVGIIFFVMYLIVKWEWKDPLFRRKVMEMKENSVTPMPLEATILDVFMMELGAITQQGAESEPKSISGRIATICTFVALMFMYTSYSANVVALLQSTTENIKTVKDLLDSRISLGMEDVVYIHYYIKAIEEPVRKAIYQQKIAPKGEKPNFMNVEEGMSRVRKGFYGFHAELSTGYKVVADTFQEHEKCGLKDITFFMNMHAPWFSTRKRSPYKELLKVSFQKLHETGSKSREISRLYMKKPICHNKGSNFGSAGLLDCYAAFLIFGIGIGCSLFVFLIEIILRKYLLHKKE